MSQGPGRKRPGFFSALHPSVGPLSLPSQERLRVLPAGIALRSVSPAPRSGPAQRAERSHGRTTCRASSPYSPQVFGRTPRPVGRGSLFARSAPLRGPARRSAPGVRTGARHAAQTARAHPWADSRAKHPCFAWPRSPADRTRLVAASGSVLREQVLCCPNEVASLTDQWGVPGRGIAESSAWMRCGGESAMGERARLARHCRACA